MDGKFSSRGAYTTETWYQADLAYQTPRTFRVSVGLGF
jgi:hypothetical protein